MCSGALEVNASLFSLASMPFRWHVYKLTANGKSQVLKKSDSKEATLYRDFLCGKGFAVPEYLDSVEHEGAVWLLMESQNAVALEEIAAAQGTGAVLLPFLEVQINDPETTREEVEADFYYRRAVETAKHII